MPFLIALSKSKLKKLPMKFKLKKFNFMCLYSLGYQLCKKKPQKNKSKKHIKGSFVVHDIQGPNDSVKDVNC